MSQLELAFDVMDEIEGLRSKSEGGAPGELLIVLKELAEEGMCC